MVRIAFDRTTPPDTYPGGGLSGEAAKACSHSETKESMLARAGSASDGPGRVRSDDTSGHYPGGGLSGEAAKACSHSETKESMLARAGSASGPIFSARR